MNAVGIDVSKGKRTVAILRPFGEVICLPFDVTHDYGSLEGLVDQIIFLDRESRVLMEATDRYHEPVAVVLHERGTYVSVLNPLAIHGYHPDGKVRKVKTDQKDSMKIAKFVLDHWTDLREHTPMQAVRQQLKIFSRQYNLCMRSSVVLQSNLISLSDKVLPRVNELFSSPERADEHQKWVDFFTTFWHCECISQVSDGAFTERYKKWCKRKGYNSSAKTAAKELPAMNELLASLREEMVRLAKELPEFETVHAIYGVGKTTAAQLMAESSDIRNYPLRNSLVGFAGIDPEVDQSGKKNSKSKPSTKRGSLPLRKTLFQIMTIYLQRSLADEAV